MDRKNQHYVPQFHLKQWSLNGKQISLYNKQTGVFVNNKASIKHVASKDYFYGQDGVLEEMLGSVEAKVSPIYKKLITSEAPLALSDEEYQFFCLYIMLCNERSLLSGDTFESLKKEQLRVSLEMHQAHGNYLDIDPNAIDDLEVEIPCFNSIRSVFKYHPIILDLKLILIKNISEADFITSDCPTIKYNLWALKRCLYSGWGSGSVGIMFFIPISPRYAVCMYDSTVYSVSGEQRSVLTLKQKTQINEINKLMLLNSYRVVFLPGNMPLEYVTNLIKKIPECKNKQNFITTLGNQEHRLIIREPQRINYIASFSFLRIVPEAMKWYVPNHAAGLMRSSVEEAISISKKMWEECERDFNGKHPFFMK